MLYHDLLGHRVSALGMGCMRLPNGGQPGQVDREAAIALIRRAYESGVNYFDTAYVYCGGESEKIVGEALSIYPRESYFIATKFPGLHVPEGGWTREKVRATFEEQLARLGTYIDFYMLHGVMESDYEIYTDPAIDLPGEFLARKQNGEIRHFGFSTHARTDTLKKFFQWQDCFEFAQMQLNYLDWTLQDAQGVYQLLREHSLPIIAMEPCRGGKLAQLAPEVEAAMRAARPEDSIASWAFRWVKALPGVAVTLSGMNTREQLEDNLKTFADDEALGEADVALLREKAVPALAEMVPCTGCRYCCAECPQQLNIPRLLSIYNEMKFDNRSFMLGALKEADLPGNCLECGACRQVCPQNIAIPELLKDLDQRIAEAQKNRARR
ncbi:MAG: aldo/keto reductase [Eubacteriales bacterium]|nr:aldo/keto reductase [Eubacteriales bacterium]